MANLVEDPFAAYDFLLEIDGVIGVGFKTVDGLEDASDVIVYREGGQKKSERKVPGLTKFGTLVCSRGITTSNALWEWRQQCKNKVSGYRRNVSVVQKDGMREIKRWNLADCWCSKYKGAAYDATSGDAALEEVEIQYEDADLA